jgi:hypothetical protein
MINKKNDTNRQDEIKKILSTSVQGIESMARKGIEGVWALNRETRRIYMSKEKTCLFNGRIIDSITHEGIDERLRAGVWGKGEKQRYLKSTPTIKYGIFEMEVEKWQTN